MYVELDSTLTPEQNHLKQEAHRFAAEVLRPAAVELDKLADPEDVIAKDSVLWKTFRKAYELGWHASHLPAIVGGGGIGPLERHIVTEEFAWGSVDFSIGLDVANAPFGVLCAMSTPDMIQQYTIPFVKDTEAKYVGCWAMTEPGHGSDTLMTTEPGVSVADCYDTWARWDGTQWVIDGAKSAWVSNGTIATHAVMMMGCDGPNGKGGGVCFIPLDLPGISKGKPLNKLGQRALNQGEIYFDSVKLPKEYMLVEPPMFPTVMDQVIAGANGITAVAHLGIARAAFEEALTYAKGRVQGGKVICEHQLIQKKLFDMFCKVEAARAFSRASWMFNATNPGKGTGHAVATKVYCSQIAFEVASEAVQIFGGMGLSKEVVVEKLFRDARAAMMEDGANDTLALVSASRIIRGQSVLP